MDDADANALVAAAAFWAATAASATFRMLSIDGERMWKPCEGGVETVPGSFEAEPWVEAARPSAFASVEDELCAK